MTKKKIEGQNIDRYCSLNFLEKFFERILLNSEKDIEFLILSDHGTRLTDHEDSYLKTFFVHRVKNKNFKKIDYRTTIQTVFSDIFKN